MKEFLASIVHRVFAEGTTTLLQESARFTPAGLTDVCLGLRADMRNCLASLPDVAFTARADAPSGEAGWTAGQIISHNTDRLLWVLGEAAATLGVELDSPRELITQHAARVPLVLSQRTALGVLAGATEYVEAAGPLLQALDKGQTGARTHHGTMGLAAWLLLACIHDNDHLDQLRLREAS